MVYTWIGVKMIYRLNVKKNNGKEGEMGSEFRLVGLENSQTP